jgi:hypothetical protein
VLLRRPPGRDRDPYGRRLRLHDPADADVEQPLVVGRLDLLGRDARRQGELAAELPVAQLAHQHALGGLLLALVAPLAADDQLALVDLDGHVALDVDPWQLHPHDDVVALAHHLDRGHEAGHRGRLLLPPGPAAAHQLVELPVHPGQHGERVEPLDLHDIPPDALQGERPSLNLDSVQPWSPTSRGRTTMAKRGRKRRGRKKNAANHGKRPNA